MPSLCTRNVENSKTRGISAATARARAGSSASAADLGVDLVDHAHARGRGRDDHLGIAEDLDEVPDQRDRFALVAGVVVHLPATGLVHREVDRVPEPFEQAAPRPCPCPGNRVSLKQVMNSETRMTAECFLDTWCARRAPRRVGQNKSRRLCASIGESEVQRQIPPICRGQLSA